MREDYEMRYMKVGSGRVCVIPDLLLLFLKIRIKQEN